MSTIQQQLHEFEAFVNQRAQEGAESLSLDALMLEWYDSKNSHEIRAIIGNGLSDIELGKGRPASIVMSELRSQLDN